MNINSIITDYIRKSILTSDFDIPMLKGGVDTGFNMRYLSGGNVLINADCLLPDRPDIVTTGTINVDHVLGDGIISPNSFKYTVTGTTAYETYYAPISFLTAAKSVTLVAYVKGSVDNSGAVNAGLFLYGDTNTSCYTEPVVNDGDYHLVSCTIPNVENLTDCRFTISAFHESPSVVDDVFNLGYIAIFAGDIPNYNPESILPITLRRPGVKVKHEQFNITTADHHVDLGFRPSCVICLANQGEGSNEGSSLGISDFTTTACHYITNNANYQSSLLDTFAYCEPDAVNNSVVHPPSPDETGFTITVEHTGSQYVNLNFLALP